MAVETSRSAATTRRDERRARDRENDDVPDVDARERRDGRARGDNAREDDVTREGCAAPCARAGVVNIGTRVEECGGEAAAAAAAAARARRGERRDASKNRDAFDGGTRAKRRDRPRLTDDDDRSVDDVRSRFVHPIHRPPRARVFTPPAFAALAPPPPRPIHALERRVRPLATPPPAPNARPPRRTRARTSPRARETRAPPPTPPRARESSPPTSSIATRARRRASSSNTRA